MNRDWNRVIHVQPTDQSANYTIRTADGKVSVESSTPADPQMVIRATSDILTSIFYGDVSPNEPYNDGSLLVQVSEADILRLDFITAMLWG